MKARHSGLGLLRYDRSSGPFSGTNRMPSPTRLARLARLATLPETRRLIVAAAQSPGARVLAGRVVHDRAGLLRELKQQRPRDLALGAARHPAVRELAKAGVLFLPTRYVPLGWVATWVTTRVVRRVVGSGRDDRR